MQSLAGKTQRSANWDQDGWIIDTVSRGYVFVLLVNISIVTHYAEGSVQPLLVRRLLFRLIPDNAPFLIRPLLKGIFGKVDQTLISPELDKHGKLVGTPDRNLVRI